MEAARNTQQGNAAPAAAEQTHIRIAGNSGARRQPQQQEPDPHAPAMSSAARELRRERCLEMRYPWDDHPQHLRLTIRSMIARGIIPEGGWFQATGVHASVVQDYARSREMQLFCLSWLEPQAVSNEMLHSNYRQRLMAQLEQADDLTALGSIGRLLEKLPPQNMQLPAAGEESLDQLGRRTELLLERVHNSTQLLAERPASLADSPEQPGSPEPDYVEESQ